MFHGAKQLLQPSAPGKPVHTLRVSVCVPKQCSRKSRHPTHPAKAIGDDFISRVEDDAKESASSQANDYVSDMVEVDRSFELLSWIWSSITNKGQEPSIDVDDDFPSFFQRDNIEWPAATEVAVFGGGCFWCLEACFQLVQGVLSVENGYAGGRTRDPTYPEVSSGDTGHAEVVRVAYDPSQVSYADLLCMFFSMHNPTTLNRQGEDVGSQYRSIVLHQNEYQQKVAEQVIAEVGGWYPDPVVTELRPSSTFYAADDYHQAYYMRNPGKGYCRMVVWPKVASFKTNFPSKVYGVLR